MVRFTSPNARGAQAFYAAIGDELMAEYDAAPHWAKKFHHLDRVAARHGPRLVEFEAVCRRVDPDGVLFNAFAAQLARAAASLQHPSTVCATA